MITDATFQTAIARTLKHFKDHQTLVHTEKWQGVDISKKPEMATHEVQHMHYQIAMPTEELQYYQGQIRPNLPWADDHFDERVCGQPINPGTQWAKWPYALKADGFRHDPGTQISSHDWSYLAGLIDGDGCISRSEHKNDFVSYHLSIKQVDHDFLTSIQRKFEVGNLTVKNNKVAYGKGGKKFECRPQVHWRITARDEVEWALKGCEPYLKLKRGKCRAALDEIGKMTSTGTSRKRVEEREKIFNHNYMQRYWPKFAGMTDKGVICDRVVKELDLHPNYGIYHAYGDLMDVVRQLAREPLTRQAILPVFFPEDTGAVHGDRVPCSLFYQFFMRNGRLDCVYFLRSCDLFRHFRDDIYLTVRLVLWVLNEVRKLNDTFWQVEPGDYVMSITSLHMFRNDYLSLSKEIK